MRRTAFRLVPGQQYKLRWAANPRLGVNPCAGDDASAYINQAEASGGSERGYIEDTSSSIIREAIEGNYQTAPLYPDSLDFGCSLAASVSRRRSC